MALTRLQMVTEVCDTVGKRLTATSISGSTLKTRVETMYINWAQRRIARYHNFYELNATQSSAATVTSVKTYPLVTGTNNLGLVLPKDISAITLIDGANSRTLVRWDLRKFRQRIPRPEEFATDRPKIYIRVGSNIELFKIPNAAYTLKIEYNKWPTELATDGQATDFESKDELLVTTTILETYLALEEYTDAAVWFQRVKGLLDDAVAVEGDMDWEPQAAGFLDDNVRVGGEYWLVPGSTPDDPLYDYPIP